MPANLPPQYYEVEKKYREAKDLHEKLVYLQQMLSIMPKHKGTEKLQAELRTKISKLKETIGKQKKSRSGGGAWYQVEKQGAGQVVLVGLPNCGKSSLLNILTNAHAEVANYPYTTQLPQVGMMEYKDIKIQIVDTPPLYNDAPPWLYGLYRNGDILLVVLDYTGNPVNDFHAIHEALTDKNIFIHKHEFGDIKKAMVILNKLDKEDGAEIVERVAAECGGDIIVLPFSTVNTSAVDILKQSIYKKLNIIRVYTKKIGKPIEKDDPVVLGNGATVLDAAEHIHKDFKRNLKFARLWNNSGYSGQRVEKHHTLTEGDVIEFHV